MEKHKQYYLSPDYMSVAPHIGHGQHLCHMSEKGEITLEEIKALVKNPRFICFICGRAALREGNLCEPVPL